MGRRTSSDPLTARCDALAEDLALLAGGDLDDARRERELHAHLADCDECTELLADLQGDREWVQAAGASISTDESCVDLDALLARASVLETETARPAARRWLPSWVEAAAAAVLLAGVFGLSGMHSGGMPVEGAVIVGPSLSADPAEAPGLPIRLEKRPGGQVALSWQDDGRSAHPYQVYFADAPGGFDTARSVHVDGQELIATTPNSGLTCIKVL
ncbi:MAG: hypothetical protein AAF533_06985 [Acidobacteriota bacterium]